MFGCVADNGNQDQTNEGLTDLCALNNGVDASNKVLSADRDKNGDDKENDCSSNRAKGRLFRLVDFVTVLALRLKKVAVGAKLECQIEDVEQQKDDSGAAR